MKKEDCTHDCDNCEVSEKFVKIFEEVYKSHKPMFVIVEPDEGHGIVMLGGDSRHVKSMLYNAVRQDKRIREIIMDVVSELTGDMLKDFRKRTDLPDIKEIMKEFVKDLAQADLEDMPKGKPKAEC